MEIPSAYGYVVLSCGVLPTIVNMYMAGKIMKARDEFDVKYPNLYATPGFHKKADEFNRVQRGHQSYVENLTNYVTMSLLGGLQHPLAVAFGGVCYAVGSILYMSGYSDTALDVSKARHLKGGPIKYIGFFTSLISSVKFGGAVAGLW
eukprot:CAMPEP_0195256132 /NCGR_PEP_ID=MMETSP0706-20130129/6052_1 /TAXON_ID=33640 /ORGANISM="Asterionellopsis glacialis, Strain CCMP134" /LENGTH=147 /DNA_ID=CAMNT_0040309113 /DNA_START=17 /DNA_END=460 /DNA_ORIENTATION=+